MKKITTLLILIIFLLLGPIVKANSITISSTVETSEQEIILKDIATITGGADFIRQIEDISLGQTPLPGYQSSFYRDNLIATIESKGLNISEIDFNIPYQFRVIADYEELAIERLIDAGSEYIYQSLDYDRENIELEVRNHPDELLRPEGELEIVPGSVSSRNLLGRTTIPLDIKIDGEIYRRVHLQYNVGLWQDILVAKDDLSRGTKLDKSQFDVETRLLTNNSISYVDPKEPLDNYELRTAVRSGRELQTRMIIIPDLVKRWDEVRLVAKIGDIRIITKARARESGKLGDIIIVENNSSGKRVEARVVGEGEVEALIN